MAAGTKKADAAALRSNLESGLQQLGLTLSPIQQQQLLDYLDLIAKWNKVYNLTSVRDLPNMLTHHILDSLSVVLPLMRHLSAVRASWRDSTQVGTGAAGTLGGVGTLGGASDDPVRILDVGSGAGLPGAVIAICCPTAVVTCVDTVGKKAAFIQQVALGLGLKNLSGVHARVERLSPLQVRAGFDVITSRAFASLQDFVGLTANWLRPETGLWMAMKAKHIAQEAEVLPANVQVFHVEPLQVPHLDEERNLVWMRSLRAPS